MSKGMTWALTDHLCKGCGGRNRGCQARRAGMTTPAAQRKAAERARHKEAGRVAVTHYIYPEDREKVARYIQRLNERAERARDPRT